MNPDDFNALLARYAQKPMPAPADLASDVWRRIESRRRLPFWTRLMQAVNWTDALCEPRFALPAFALAVAIGVLPVLVRSDKPQSGLARAALGFEVFSSEAPAMPSTLLAVHVVNHANR